MIERVNFTEGAMVGKGQDIAVRAAEHKQIVSMRSTVRAKNRAKRALKVIESVKSTAKRWG